MSIERLVSKDEYQKRVLRNSDLIVPYRGQQLLREQESGYESVTHNRKKGAAEKRRLVRKRLSHRKSEILKKGYQRTNNVP